MHEIRLVGRGGQGVVTAGDLLGRAAVDEGKFAQSIPTFGPERRGALSMCTVRIDEREILHKYSATKPTAVVVLDPTIWHTANILAGLVEGGVLVFNTERAPKDIDRDLREATYRYQIHVFRYQLYTVDASRIAMTELKRPITNTATLGAVAQATQVVRLESIERVFAERFGDQAPMNIAAARSAANELKKLGD